MDETSRERQVDGHHYTEMKIQPFEISMANNLDPVQHTILKYVMRFRDKGGATDLLKAIHCCILELGFVYPGWKDEAQYKEIRDMLVGLLEDSSADVELSHLPSYHVENYRSVSK